MAKRTGLGKGLGAIFGDEVMESAAEEQEKKNHPKPEQVNIKTDKKEEEPEVGREMFLKLSSIEPNHNQPRMEFREESLMELAESMKEYGVLQPLLVQKKGDFYEIIAGERRWRAAKLAGLKEVPVVIREYTKQQSMEIALIENVQREDLNPIEEAKAYQKLMQEFGLKQEEIATRVAKNRVTITNSMRLLKLENRVQDMLIQNQITGGHARALLAVDDPELQFQIAGRIVAENLSVREVEKLVKSFSKKKEPKEKKEEDESIFLIFRELEDRMKTAMGTKVSINRKDSNKGRVEIEYYSEAELERIVELIESIR
jgi:ParB family chromosome partitioning protein